MKSLSIGLLITALLASGYLCWKNEQPLKTLISSEEITVNIKGLAFTEPEIMTARDTVYPRPPEIIKTQEELNLKATNNTQEEQLIPLSSEVMGKAKCILIGPIYEEMLPKIREPLKKNGLIEGLIIENIPVRFSFSVFVGPYKEKRLADREALRLNKAGVNQLKVIQLGNQEIVIKIREFSEAKEAEVWAREFVSQYGVKNVRLSRLDDSEKARIRLVFPAVDAEGVHRIKTFADSNNLSAYICPRY